MSQEYVAVYFKALFQQPSGDTEENHENTHPV
jgi:hypothetical protein